MKRAIPIMLALCLLLSGCSGWLDSHYQSVTPHEEPFAQPETENVSVSNYTQLCQTLRTLVESGAEKGIISIARYDQKQVQTDVNKAVKEIMKTDPVAAYAVEDIAYEFGANAGQYAVAVTISYLHGRSEIQKIQRVADLQEAKTVLSDTMNKCNSGIVLYVDAFEELDFEQWVSDYAAENPDLVMEVPAVSASVYPEEGEARVVELRFAYQNSRESLRLMQSKVSILFDAAAIYAGEEGDTAERYFKLYSFLMGLFQTYQLDSSLTPAYSLLQHGVGDTKAFATVYAAMCEKAGLECIVVTGMRAGEARYWNMVLVDDIYYHVDLLACEHNDEFKMQTDVEMRDGGEMTGYVWDYQAYPVCGIKQPEE